MEAKAGNLLHFHAYVSYLEQNVKLNSAMCQATRAEPGL